jgi:hypothetical protein
LGFGRLGEELVGDSCAHVLIFGMHAWRFGGERRPMLP